MTSNQLAKNLKAAFLSFNIIGRKIIIFIVILFVLSLTGLIVLWAYDSVEDKSFGRTISDTLLKIISGTVIGTTAAILLSDYSQKQLERKNQDQYKKDLLQRLHDLYAKTKNARRMLRAKGFTTQWYGKEDDSCLVKRKVYDHYMNDINECQAELEAIKKEIFTGKNIFFDPEMIIKYLEDMDTYLGNLISEYEKKLPCFEGEPALLRISELSDLKNFISSASIVGGFKDNFSIKYKEITINIRNEINFISSKKVIDVKEIVDDDKD